MPGYKIIGGDRKEYGPVTAEQLRQWVAEKRANAQTLAQPEGGAEWKPLYSWPEFADLAGGLVPLLPPVTPGAAVPPPPPETVLGRDYELDILNCISRSWALLQRHFWPIVGISLLVWLAQSAVGQILGLFAQPFVKDALTELIQNHRLPLSAVLIYGAIGLVTMPLNTLLFAGLYKYYLNLIRGQKAGVADAFSGFSSIAPQLLLLGLVNGCLTLLGAALCILPGIFLSVAWIFSIPLVIDRRMRFWDAMEFSRKVVTRHWFMVLGLLVLVGLIAAAGLIACCIGFFVTVPLAWIALMYAYEDIFSRQAP
jgi:hypothetical protein